MDYYDYLKLHYDEYLKLQIEDPIVGEPNKDYQRVFAYAVRQMLRDHKRMHSKGSFRGWHILEVGCGEFYTSKHFKGAHMVGIDLKEEAKTYDVDILIVDAHHMDEHFDHGSFDLIISSHAFEHMLDLPTVLQNCHTLLRTGGWLCYIIPIPSREGGTWASFEPHVYNIKDHDHMARLIKNAGFTVIDSFETTGIRERYPKAKVPKGVFNHPCMFGFCEKVEDESIPS